MTILAQIAGEGAPLGVGRYAYGVSFRNVDAATREEIHRFVHLWQRRQLRVRRAQRESS
jgi:c-di-GMP-binding flagellar brake protein YcgR